MRLQTMVYNRTLHSLLLAYTEHCVLKGVFVVLLKNSPAIGLAGNYHWEFDVIMNKYSLFSHPKDRLHLVKPKIITPKSYCCGSLKIALKCCSQTINEILFSLVNLQNSTNYIQMHMYLIKMDITFLNSLDTTGVSATPSSLAHIWAQVTSKNHIEPRNEVLERQKSRLE